LKSYEFLFWAYNVIWIVLAGYLLTMVLRMRRLDERLGRLEQELERQSSDR
jgi:CcmD family protein